MKIPYKLTGRLDYKIVSKTHGLIEHVTTNNMVLSAIKPVIIQLLGGGTDSITKFGIGSNNTTPVISDTTLTDPIYFNIGDIDTESSPEAVTYSYIVAYDEANGSTVGEYGLLTTSGILVARTVRTPFTKTRDITIIGTWTLEY
jgi:hypothetical protein